MGLTGAFIVTPHAFEDPVIDDDGLVERVAGHRLVAVETTISNITPERQPFSTMLQVELVDSRDRPWATSVFGVADRSGLDVILEPGETRRGWVGFEVANDADGFQLLVRGDLTADAMSFSIS